MSDHLRRDARSLHHRSHRPAHHRHHHEVAVLSDPDYYRPDQFSDLELAADLLADHGGDCDDCDNARHLLEH